VVRVGVTDHPTDEWITQQVRDATPFEEKPKFLICDHDNQYRVLCYTAQRVFVPIDRSITWPLAHQARSSPSSSGGVDQMSKEYDNRLKQAVPGASAKIIELGSSYTSRNYGTMSVAMRMEVTPAFGQPYQTISVWEIEPVHASEMQVGKSFPVKVDAKNPKIIFPDLRWAQQLGTTESNEDDMTN